MTNYHQQLNKKAGITEFSCSIFWRRGTTASSESIDEVTTSSSSNNADSMSVANQALTFSRLNQSRRYD